MLFLPGHFKVQSKAGPVNPCEACEVWGFGLGVFGPSDLVVSGCLPKRLQKLLFEEYVSHPGKDGPA